MLQFWNKKNTVKEWEQNLMINIFSMLPDKYRVFKEQVLDGLLKTVSHGSKHIINYVGFSYNPDIAKKYINEQASFFCLRGIKVFDEKAGTWVEFIIYVADGLICGYSTPERKDFLLSVKKTKIENFREQYFNNEEFNKISKLFTQQELKMINPTDVYEIKLGENTFYHIKDLEDGDFIGIDDKKNVYKLTHDPFEAKLLGNNLLEYLN